MKRMICGCVVALAFGPTVFAQQPSPAPWAALVFPDEAAARGYPAASEELSACFTAKRTALFSQPQDVMSLMPDWSGADAVKRDCAMAVQADRIKRSWARSSSANGYGPVSNLVSDQNKSLARLSDTEKCEARAFVLESMTTVNGMLGGEIPAGTYEWIDPSKNAACAAFKG
jgi:hypothetical protein